MKRKKERTGGLWKESRKRRDRDRSLCDKKWQQNGTKWHAMWKEREQKVGRGGAMCVYVPIGSIKLIALLGLAAAPPRLRRGKRKTNFTISSLLTSFDGS